MDPAPPRTAKNTSSTIPGLFFRFSKICRRSSVGVLSGDRPKPTTHEAAGRGEDSDSEDPKKVHPQLQRAHIPYEADKILVSRLFDAISALKSAYVELQRAHIPYEADKIRVADALVVSELESLSQLEQLYYTRTQSSNPLLEEELQSKIQSQDSEILRLRWELEELELKNAELEEEIDRKSELFVLQQEWTPSVFHHVFMLASKSIHEFGKPLISLMKASGWDLIRAADAIDSSVVYTERSHGKFAFESYLARIMLTGGHDECFKMDHFDRVMSFQEPFDALLDDPDSDFGRFCRSKYVAAVHSKMEGSFFGNLDQRAFVLSGGHPRTPFYQVFVKMAKWVWALQVLAHSFIPKAEMFCANKGQLYNQEYMESVVNMGVIKGDDRLTVGITVTPGFKIGRNVIRCRVYLYRIKSSSS